MQACLAAALDAKKGVIRKRLGKHVTDSTAQLALREMRTNFSHPATWVVLAAVAGILGLAGPFGTDDLLRLAPRFAYWLVLVAGSYGCGVAASALARALIQEHLPQLTLASLLTGTGVSAVVTTLNWLVFAFLPDPGELPVYLGTIYGISIIVTVAANYLARQSRAPKDSAQSPPLLDRLPFETRGRLLALSVEDHYVRVRTHKGVEMLLMRLSDAMLETGGVRGAQVHRSHWVAFDAVQSARRIGDRAVLTLTDGAEIPVSRANIPVIREAGFLPSRSNG